MKTFTAAWTLVIFQRVDMLTHIGDILVLGRICHKKSSTISTERVGVFEGQGEAQCWTIYLTRDNTLCARKLISRNQKQVSCIEAHSRLLCCVEQLSLTQLGQGSECEMLPRCGFAARNATRFDRE